MVIAGSGENLVGKLEEELRIVIERTRWWIVLK